MAWIESHQELSRHPKTKKLARKLNVSVPAVIGHLHFLWWWAMDYAQEGILSQYEPDDIADAMMWEGDSDLLISSLVEVGFLDETEDGLHIHDWDEYAGRLIDKRKQNAERKKMSRARHADSPQDGQDGHRATKQNHTEPNPTKPKQKKIEMVAFAPLVRMTQDEFTGLVEKIGEPLAKDYIERLNGYMGSTGKKYKSHYLTILNWHRNDLEKVGHSPAQQNNGPPKEPKGWDALRNA